MTRAGSHGSPRPVIIVAIVQAALASIQLGGVASAEEALAEESLYVSQVSTAATGDLAPDAEIVREDRPLTVSEAVALAIQNSLDLEVERHAPLIAETSFQQAWGAYDPTLSADMTYDVAKTPTTSPLQADPELIPNQRNRTKGGGIGVQQLIPYVGATLEARYEGSNTSTRNRFNAYSDQLDSSFFITATVPLARGLLWNTEWTNVKVTEQDYSASKETFRREVMDTVLATIRAYWQLVATRDQVGVAQKSLETSRALLEQTKTQYEVGVVSRVEVVEAEAGVAERELGVIQSANDYRNAQDELIDIVLGPELSGMTDLQFSPTDDPYGFEEQTVNVAQSVAKAFQNRPELRELERRIDAREIDLKFAKNQRLPIFDAEVRFGYVGVSGEQNPRAIDFSGGGGSPPPPPNVGPFDGSDDRFFNRNGAENVRVTGTFAIPFPNTTARKRVVQRRLELRRAETEKSRLEQEIIVEIRTAARTLAASAQGIEASERRRLAAEEQLRAERIRLEHGESTPFKVLEKEEDLVEAESQKIRALQTYRVAEVVLERAQGTILEAHRVEVEDVRRRPMDY